MLSQMHDLNKFKSNPTQKREKYIIICLLEAENEQPNHMTQTSIFLSLIGKNSFSNVSSQEINALFIL